MTQLQTVDNPFNSKNAPAITEAGGAMALSDQARQVAEIQSRITLAKLNPRNQREAFDNIINACTRPGLAESAVYQYARGGSDVSGPSIRLAETIAQEWCNFEFGFRELSRGTDAAGVTYSDVEAFAWDLQKNSRRTLSFRVRHWRDRKSGGYRISDERDIYELMANQAQRRVRACILALIPGDIIEAAVQQCEMTLNAKADTGPDAIAKMVDAFAPFGVTKKQLETRIQRRLDAITPAQVVSLKKIYASLRDGMSAAEEWFEPEATASATQAPEGAASEANSAASSRAAAARAALNKNKQPENQPDPGQNFDPTSGEIFDDKTQ